MSILVTGGTKGIGLAIAMRFAKPGTDVFVNYHRDEDAAARAVKEIEARGARAHALRADVGTPEGARGLLASVSERVDHLDQLVHCAVRVVPSAALDADPHEFTAAVNLNGTALLYLVQAADAESLFRAGSTVFFLTSRGGRMVLPNYAAVGVAKALAESLVRYLAVELAPRGVRVNAVGPAAVDTEALRQVFGDRTDTVLAEQAAANPSGRAVTHDDYTGLIEFLAGPEAAMIQGQVIFVNGGLNVSA